MEADLRVLLITTAIPYAVFSTTAASLAPLFEDTFPSLSESEIGLCYLGIGTGGIIGTISVGKLLDIQYQFVKRRFEKSIASDSEKTTEADGERTLVNIIDHENFPMEESRLLAQNIWMLSLAIATTGYGWAVQSKTSIAVPLILQFIGELFLCKIAYILYYWWLNILLSWIYYSGNYGNEYIFDCRYVSVSEFICNSCREFFIGHRALPDIHTAVLIVFSE